MRLRTVTGNRYETRCQCGSCSEVIPPSDTIKVVIDLDLPAGKRTYLFAHSPDAGKWKGNGSTASPAPSNGGNGHATGFAPASALPSAPPKVPEPSAQPSGPSPVPLALLGSVGAAEPSPNAQAGTAWATSQLTFAAAAYESCKAGYADYARPGETPEALRSRVHAVVLEDVEWQARALRDLHAKLGGTAALTTPSPAPRAGAPSGAASPPRMIVPSASPASEGASPGCRTHPSGSEGPLGTRPTSEEASAALPRLSPSAAGAGPGAQKPPTQIASGERPLKVLVHEVRLDLSDADPLRLSRKMKVWVDWLGKRGYTSANDVRPGDEWALERVLGDFEAVNRGGRP